MSDRVNRKTNRGNNAAEDLVIITALEIGWVGKASRAFTKRYGAKLDINSIYLLDEEKYRRKDGKTVTSEQKAFLDAYQMGYFAASNRAAEVFEKYGVKIPQKVKKKLEKG